MTSRIRCTALRRAALTLCAAMLPAALQAQDRETAPGTNPPGTNPETPPAMSPARVLETPTVEVIGTTPLPGLGVPVNEVPANVKALTDRDVEQLQTTNLPDLLDATLPSVNVNEIQGNPFQPQVNYRGFTSSPLLGSPQGLSVFQDGVRINEPFGDVVNWDLVPENAIANINLIPGSNPLFGLNTLGGALSIRTKSGAYFPDTDLSAYGGSWGRWSVQGEHGGYFGHQGLVHRGHVVRGRRLARLLPERSGAAVREDRS